MIASQDFIILSLFLLLKKSGVISIDVYFSSGIAPDWKETWNEEEKIAPNHPNTRKKRKKKIMCPAKAYNFVVDKVIP